MKYDHTIVHDGKECNAVEIIKALDLNHSVYYKQRKEGISAQDAFLYCLNLKQKPNMDIKNDKVIYNEKEYRTLELIKKLDMSYSTYYLQRKNGMTAQEAFLHCLNLKQIVTIQQFAKETKLSANTIRRGFHNGLSLEEIKEIQQEKKENQFQTLEYLRKIGLPLEYNSLTDFCIREQLNLVRIYKGIQKGMNLYEAVQNSLIIKDGYIKRASKYFGVQLKSIAQKYKLDPNQINFWLRKGYSYQETIEKEVFARTFSAFGNDVRKFQYLWKIYQNEFLKGIDIQDKVTDRELESFVVSYNRMEHITRDLTYYEFLEGVGISYYKLLSLDERVQDVLLTDSNVSFTLSELYYILDFEYGLMSEFTYIEKYHVWIYSGNREVLKKLKKPSD